MISVMLITIHKLASFPGSPSFRAISIRMTSKVICLLIARKEGEPGNEANTNSVLGQQNVSGVPMREVH